MKITFIAIKYFHIKIALITSNYFVSSGIKINLKDCRLQSAKRLNRKTETCFTIMAFCGLIDMIY